MKKLVVFSVLIFIFTITVTGQGPLPDFCTESKRLETNGMYVLGGWALANIAYGTYGWVKYDGHLKYFSQMNLFWNTVNLAIAGISLYSTSQIDCNSLSVGEALARQMKTEKILLVNTALDAVYVGTGVFLRILSDKSDTRQNLLKGYGNSLILQGAFLLAFDLTFYEVLNNHQPVLIKDIGFTVSPGMTGFYLALQF